MYDWMLDDVAAVPPSVEASYEMFFHHVYVPSLMPPTVEDDGESAMMACKPVICLPPEPVPFGGKIERTVGDLTDNEELEAKGAAKEAAAKAKQAGEKVKDAALDGKGVAEQSAIATFQDYLDALGAEPSGPAESTQTRKRATP